MGGPQLTTRIDSPVFAAQPFTINEVAAGKLHPEVAATEVLKGFPIETVGNIAVGQQGSQACFDT